MTYIFAVKISSFGDCCTPGKIWFFLQYNGCLKCNVTIQWGISNLCFRQRSKSKVGICVLVHTTPLPYTHLSWPHLPILTWKTEFFCWNFASNCNISYTICLQQFLKLRRENIFLSWGNRTLFYSLLSCVHKYVCIHICVCL